MINIEDQYEKARIYLLSTIDNKKNKAMVKTFEILENKSGTHYTLFADKENSANLEEFHYPSFKEDMIEELSKFTGNVSNNQSSGIVELGMASEEESFQVKFNDEKEIIELFFKQYKSKE